MSYNLSSTDFLGKLSISVSSSSQRSTLIKSILLGVFSQELLTFGTSFSIYF